MTHFCYQTSTSGNNRRTPEVEGSFPTERPAVYFILKAEIECPIVFTRSAFCLPWREGLCGQNEIPGQWCRSQTASRWQVETREVVCFSDSNSVTPRWSSPRAAEGQCVLETKMLSVHLSFGPGSDCFLSAANSKRKVLFYALEMLFYCLSVLRWIFVASFVWWLKKYSEKRVTCYVALLFWSVS